MTSKPYEKLDDTQVSKLAEIMGYTLDSAGLSGKGVLGTLNFSEMAEQAVEEIDHTLIRFTDSVAYYIGGKQGLERTLATRGLEQYVDRIKGGEPLQIRVNPIHVRDTRPLGLYFDGDFVCDVGSLTQEHTYAIAFKTIPLMHKDLYTEQVQKSLLKTYGEQLLRENPIGKRTAIHVEIDVKNLHTDVLSVNYSRLIERGYLPISYSESEGKLMLVRVDKPTAIERYIEFYPKLQSLDFDFVSWMG